MFVNLQHCSGWCNAAATGTSYLEAVFLMWLSDNCPLTVTLKMFSKYNGLEIQKHITYCTPIEFLQFGTSVIVLRCRIIHYNTIVVQYKCILLVSYIDTTVALVIIDTVHLL